MFISDFIEENLSISFSGHYVKARHLKAYLSLHVKRRTEVPQLKMRAITILA